MRDRVFKNASSDIVDFAFSAEVAAVFPDMIRRSVPGYETVIPMTGLIAANHLASGHVGSGVEARPGGGLVLDLGCSLGATSQAILAQNPDPDLRLVGIDNARAMIEGANQANQDKRATFQIGDIVDAETYAEFEPADVIILNYVLQFTAPEGRAEVLRLIRSALKPDGLLILSEKVKHADPALHAFYDDTHLSWKRANGYSELEVSQKRNALENVMRVDTEETHEQRLKDAGFAEVQQWYRCMNWASFIARPNRESAAPR